MIRLPCCGKDHKDKCRVQYIEISLDRSIKDHSLVATVEMELTWVPFPTTTARMHLTQDQLLELVGEFRKAGWTFMKPTERRTLIRRLNRLRCEIQKDPKAALDVLATMVDQVRNGK